MTRDSLRREGADQGTCFLFCFGFESPVEWLQNQRDGTDFESSEAVWIDAGSATEAKERGLEFAERHVADLFREAGVELPKSWLELGYAHWIETDAEDLDEARQQIPPLPRLSQKGEGSNRG